MLITSERKNDKLIVKIFGIIDAAGAKILRYNLSEIAVQNPHQVVLDLSKVPAIGSEGIGVILLFSKTLQRNKANFKVYGINENLYLFFKLLKLDEIIPISR